MKNKVFIVRVWDEEEPGRAFSTREKAIAYKQRYPDMGPDPMEIYEVELDVDFISLPDKSPYHVYMGNDGEIRDIYPIPYESVEELAMQDIVEVSECGGAEFYFLARNKTDAVRISTKKYRQMMNDGKWPKVEQE